jgi:hypothetical protein
MLFGILAIIVVALTVAMFATKQSMLGFPCLIFWALLSGYSYQQSVTTWDLYYLLFFSSMGMAIFCTFAAFALRTKKEERQVGEEYIDEGEDDSRYADESRPGGNGFDVEKTEKSKMDSGEPSRRVRVVRERAERRREQGVTRHTTFGEFK